MKIIHLVSPKDTNWGGAGRYIKDLCEYSVKEGYKPLIFTRGIPAVDSLFASPGVEIRKLLFGGPLDFFSPWKLARAVLSLPDDEIVVHTHSFLDAELAVRAKRIIGNRKKFKVICTRHIVRRGKRTYRWKRILSGIDKLIFVSAVAMDEFLSANPPADLSKLMVIHNSIVTPPDLSINDRDSNTDIRILFVGRVSEEKGINTLIQGLRYLKDENFQLVIVGTGPKDYIASLKALAQDLKVEDRILWAGFFKDVFPEIRKSDICVVPSKCREACPLVVAESISQGKPTVATDNGGQKEIITDGVDGLLVPPEDPVALANAIRRLIADRELRKNMGTEALKTFRDKFSYPVFFAKTIATYRS